MRNDFLYSSLGQQSRRFEDRIADMSLDDKPNTLEAALETISIQQYLLLEASEALKKKDALIIKTLKQAYSDALTGLLGLRGFNKAIEYETESLNDGDSVGGVVVAIDMSRLKMLNDQYGHAAGDEALTIFAKTLSDNTRDTDILARCGGDEFIIMRNTKENDVMRRIDNLNKHISRVRFSFDGKELEIGARMGVAKYDSNISIQEARDIADKREAFVRDNLIPQSHMR